MTCHTCWDICQTNPGCMQLLVACTHFLLLPPAAAPGVDPAKCLPMCLDVGTNNKRLLADPDYKGLKQHRPGRQEFDAFVAEVLGALQAWRPHLLLQFEDFANNNAFHLLHDWRHRMCCFNDDIQVGGWVGGWVQMGGGSSWAKGGQQRVGGGNLRWVGGSVGSQGLWGGAGELEHLA